MHKPLIFGRWSALWIPPIVKRRDIEKFGEYRTKQLILAYYDDYATGHMTTWHGPEELREPMMHSAR